MSEDNKHQRMSSNWCAKGSTVKTSSETKHTEATSYFWSSVCFDCPYNKKNEALNSFFNKSMSLDEKTMVDLRSCKVCVKYAMALSDVRKSMAGVERFFHIKK